MSEEYLTFMNNLDPSTLNLMMDQYGQDIWNYAYFLTKNRSMSDDITQDVFLKVYSNIQSYRGESSLKTWLLAITRNVSRNHLHTAFIRKVLLVDLVLPPGTGRSAEDEFLENEAANEIWKNVFKLPAKHREVIVLQAKYQLSIQEMSDILGIPQGTVKSRLSDARRKMRKLIAQEEGIQHEPI